MPSFIVVVVTVVVLVTFLIASRGRIRDSLNIVVLSNNHLRYNYRNIISSFIIVKMLIFDNFEFRE